MASSRLLRDSSRDTSASTRVSANAMRARSGSTLRAVQVLNAVDGAARQFEGQVVGACGADRMQPEFGIRGSTGAVATARLASGEQQANARNDAVFEASCHRVPVRLPAVADRLHDSTKPAAPMSRRKRAVWPAPRSIHAEARRFGC